MNNGIIHDKIYLSLKTLELPVLTSLKELRAKYKTQSKLHHPDSGGDSKKMSEINEAYEVLKEYMENYRFNFSQDEISKQFPEDEHARRFKF